MGLKIPAVIVFIPGGSKSEFLQIENSLKYLFFRTNMQNKIKINEYLLMYIYYDDNIILDLIMVVII